MLKKKYDLCDSTNIRILVDMKGSSLTSDGRIVDASLKKFQCKNCGLVFGERYFGKKDAIVNYEKNSKKEKLGVFTY